MNAAEAGQLLLAISAFDGREITRVDAQAWSSVLADVPLDDALPAVHDHFRTKSGIGLERIMPKDVLEYATVLQHVRIVDAYGDTMRRAIEQGSSVDDARTLARAARDRARERNPLGIEAAGV